MFFFIELAGYFNREDTSPCVLLLPVETNG